MSLRSFKSIIDRRRYIEKTAGVRLKTIASYPKSINDAQWKNCENMIGVTQVPLGVAGPLRIKGNFADGNYYLPLATTEGALVASVNRGCKAITLSGGATVISQYQGITRGSIFTTFSVSDSFELKKWLENNFALLADVAGKTSSHLELINIDIRVLSTNVFVRFSFDCQDAMGMNMATVASQAVADFIFLKTQKSCVAIAGNYDIDKKPAWLNFIMGRGRQVWAEADLESKFIKNVLKTTAEKIHQVAIRKCLYGSIMSGSIGFNAHYANIIAAMFIACGQDAAHTVEGSLGITTTEIIDSRLKISVYLPDIAIGVIGGGTRLPAQKEALSILGLLNAKDGKKASQFAEIIGAAVLAGEISTLASISAGTLAASHQKLARQGTKK